MTRLKSGPTINQYPFIDGPVCLSLNNTIVIIFDTELVGGFLIVDFFITSVSTLIHLYSVCMSVCLYYKICFFCLFNCEKCASVPTYCKRREQLV